MMRVLFDNTPDPDADHTYQPRALPGMEEMVQPEQGLLWADMSKVKVNRTKQRGCSRDSVRSTQTNR